MLKKRDSMTAMVEARTRRGRHTPLAQFFLTMMILMSMKSFSQMNATGSKVTLLPALPATNSSLREYFSMFNGDE